MKATVEKISSNKVKISFEIEAEKFSEALDAAYRKNVKRINIPGFRKGKAPRKVVEAHYGPSVFYEDAFDEMFPEIYEKVVDENKLNVVDRPSIDFTQIERGKDLIFTCEVFVTPDVTLGDYKGIEVVKVEPTLDAEAVEREINRARENAARMIEVERPAEKGDTVVIDYAGFDGDNQFEGGTAEDHELELGSGTFIPGFEDQLIGAVAGEERDVNVTFPEQYHAPELAGKPVVFKCKVKAVQRKELPELDDDFAQDVSEFDTFEEYKKSVEDKKLAEAREQADAQMENDLVNKIVANAEIDVPQAMIARQADQMINSMAQRMRYQGITLDDFLKYTGQTIDMMRQQYMPEAERRVRTELTLKAIAAAEQVTPTDDEISDKIDEFAKQAGQTPEEFKEKLAEEDMEYITDIVKLQKTVDMLKSEARYIDKPAEEPKAEETEAGDKAE
ncbi:MAG: trigger factor [Candidatus Fimadaptatus sp.]